MLLEDSWLVFDEEKHESLIESAPWGHNSTFFKTVCVSSVALLKMALHAEAGGTIEVMGLLQGFMAGKRIFVKDVFALPVIGTETRVNAAEDAGEYTVGFLAAAQAAAHRENLVGWYHSHPGYGCWLSGIDVATQRLQQKSDPSVAIVVDPCRTASGPVIDIAAFRVCANGSGSRAAPETHSERFLDYGAHSSEYYELRLQVYRTPADDAAMGVIREAAWPEALQPQPSAANGPPARTDEEDSLSYMARNALKESLGFMLTEAIYLDDARTNLRERLKILVDAAAARDQAMLR